MGKCMFKACTVTHNCTCQISKITFMEKSKWQRPKLFCKCNTSTFTFLIGTNISFCILQTSLDKGTQRKTTENELPSLTQCTA